MTHQEKWASMDAKRSAWHAKRDAVPVEDLRLAFQDDPLASPEALDAVESYNDFLQSRMELANYVREHE